MEEKEINRISAMRFNALGGYARAPGTLLTFEELEYYEGVDQSVIGVATKDHTDQDFGGLVLARDRKHRFRCVDVIGFFPSLEEAKKNLFERMQAAIHALDEDHHQGDENGAAVDFFSHVYEAERLHPSFIHLTTDEGYSPAQNLIEPMMRWYEDADGNFVEQFQTTGFDQRIWELYLFATLTEVGYEFNRECNAPDFVCSGLRGSISVEAVTIGPTIKDGCVVPPPPVDTPEATERYLKDYMPIKFGSPLYTKLQKKYHELPHVNGAPFVLAVADFSAPMSMVWSQSALGRYLYGYQNDEHPGEDGKLSISPVRIETHTWEGKEIPSGFFRQPEADNISAVMSSTAGTIAKFNRMGIQSGFGSERVLAIRSGAMVDRDPEATLPKFFRVIVNSEGYEEGWIEGIEVYHNPRAKIPMPMEMLPGAAHHFCDEAGRVTSHTPEFHPISSTTQHFVPVDVEAILAEFAGRTHMVWTPKL